MKLSFKISIAIFCITLAISVASGVMMYDYFSGILLEQLNRDDRAKLDTLAAEVDKIWQEAEKYGRQISVDSAVQDYLAGGEYPSVFHLFRQRRDIREYFSMLTFLSENIHSIALVKGREDIVWTASLFEDAATVANRARWYDALADAVGTENFTSRLLSEPYLYGGAAQRGNETFHLISIVIPLRSIDHPSSQLGSVVINIDWATVDALIQSHRGDFDALAFLCGGESVFYTAAQGITFADAEGIASLEAPSASYGAMTYHKAGTALNGQLVAIQNHPGLMGAVRPQAMMLLLVLAAGVLLIVSVLIPVLLRMTRPTLVLADAMKRVGKGELDTRVNIRTKDEFEDLGEGFNRMVQQLDSHIQQSIQHEKDMHQLEYEVLVAQINPHFIYNTLNTIIHLARRDSSDDVIRLTSALIDLLQDGIKLSGNKIYSTVEEEMWIISNYMVIQNYRYKDMFELVVSCPEALAKTLVPSSVIQPLVENALFHGIAPLGRKGKIWLNINVEAQGELTEAKTLSIEIADEGVGITPEASQRLLAGQQPISEGARNHVGVHNVLNRLELLYGGAFTFTISPREGGGTRIHIVLPNAAEEPPPPVLL